MGSGTVCLGVVMLSGKVVGNARLDSDLRRPVVIARGLNVFSGTEGALAERRGS